MVCAQVIGNDLTITVAGQSGNFQLNVMLPVVTLNLLETIGLLSKTCTALNKKVFHGFTVNREKAAEPLAKTRSWSLLSTRLSVTKKAQPSQKKPIVKDAPFLTWQKKIPTFLVPDWRNRLTR